MQKYHDNTSARLTSTGDTLWLSTGDILSTVEGLSDLRVSREGATAPNYWVKQTQLTISFSTTNGRSYYTKLLGQAARLLGAVTGAGVEVVVAIVANEGRRWGVGAGRDDDSGCFGGCRVTEVIVVVIAALVNGDGRYIETI
jgi:hypothetical protein